ncbi:(deoxy)nucleoside triphosphate pyrophosphohydrolase [Clostridium sp. AL.422]|uniref:(deoxy)nucleoside triphosphate pyrophosphohydrolase n=1 Tax=Clostridium TaxID=1485 RepID=UPI00293DA40A|nr:MULTISPECIES: (deoxy)nucleoside triphosphate pyrophosphohydrolase [unclassified Clostridium]MDV4152084.1 (deoxy)nucleoside triphosphate pyrophosphohydrolase [Clostridium sp. AL.422]
MKKIVKVIDAIIENDKSEVLCTLRSKDMSLSGLWEFPGGKIEDGEPPEKAIIREINKKLGCRIKVNSLFTATTYEYDDYILNLMVAKCTLLGDNLSPTEYTKLLWLPIEYIPSLNWNPTIIPTVNKLILKHKKNSISN